MNRDLEFSSSLKFKKGVDITKQNKIFNITKNKSQPAPNIIKSCNADKVRYNGYLAIFMFKLISSIFIVDICLGKFGQIFGHYI